jgi:hypothetical protein
MARGLSAGVAGGRVAGGWSVFRLKSVSLQVTGVTTVACADESVLPSRPARSTQELRQLIERLRRQREREPWAA